MSLKSERTRQVGMASMVLMALVVGMNIGATKLDRWIEQNIKNIQTQAHAPLIETCFTPTKMSAESGSRD